MLTGLVLSGGESSRMGQEKGLVNLNGDPMVSYVVNSMLDLVDEIIISVAKGRAALYDEYSEIGFDIVEDNEPGFGPIQGVVSAMRKMRGDYVLVGPCDTPFLKQEICKLVLSKAEGRDGAVPMVKGMYEPLHGAYRKDTALKAFEEVLAKGAGRLVDVYDRLDIAKVEEDELRAVDPELDSFWNLNEPDDLVRAEIKLRELGQ
jgi:molybdopterin-guanine dinucleotide biosynthesis protein A